MLTIHIRRLAIPATLALAVSGSAVAAQETTRDTVARGPLPALATDLRVRIEPSITTLDPVIGLVLSSSGDSIAVLGKNRERAGFARQDLRRVQASEGRETARGAVTGALLGTMLSLVLVAGTAYLEVPAQEGGDSLEATKMMATIGVVGIIPLSALIGGASAPERWRTVWERP